MPLTEHVHSQGSFPRAGQNGDQQEVLPGGNRNPGLETQAGTCLDLVVWCSEMEQAGFSGEGLLEHLGGCTDWGLGWRQGV